MRGGGKETKKVSGKDRKYALTTDDLGKKGNKWKILYGNQIVAIFMCVKYNFKNLDSYNNNMFIFLRS